MSIFNNNKREQHSGDQHTPSGGLGGLRGSLGSFGFRSLLVACIAVVFVMFWLIGFDTPYDEDPNFNAPLFTDLLLVFTIMLLAFAIGVAAWSVVRSLKVSGRGERYSNNIPVRKIGLMVAAGTLVVMLMTFVTGSTSPMAINGSTYSDALGLKLSDMFVGTSVIMIVAAVAAVLYGSTKYIRRP